ncbi:MAG: hypothetical protein ACI9Y1_003626 [Lentisphaeria bacterium]|jgi:hypothetical protein
MEMAVNSFSFLNLFVKGKRQDLTPFFGVIDISRSNNNGAIVAAVISAKDGLNLRVIAEGAEGRKQLNFLNARKCEQEQKQLDKGSDQGKSSHENRKKWWKIWGE